MVLRERNSKWHETKLYKKWLFEPRNRLQHQKGAQVANKAVPEYEFAGRLLLSADFDGVSTRELAAVSKVNISAIKYYFQGKDGLYRSVLEQLVEDTETLFDPMIMKIESDVMNASGKREHLADVAEWFVNHLLSGILIDPKNTMADAFGHA